MKHANNFKRTCLSLLLSIAMLLGIFAAPATLIASAQDGQPEFGDSASSPWYTLSYGSLTEEREFLTLLVDMDHISSVSATSVKDLVKAVTDSVTAIFVHKIQKTVEEAVTPGTGTLQTIVDEILKCESFEDVNVDLMLPMMIDRGFFTLDELEAMDWDDVFSTVQTKVEEANGPRIAELTGVIADLEAYCAAFPTDVEKAEMLQEAKSRKAAYEDLIANGLTDLKAQIFAKIAQLRAGTEPPKKVEDELFDLFTLLKSVSVDGYKIVEDGKLVLENLHVIYERYFDFATYAQYTDTQMRSIAQFDVSIVSDYGDVDIALTAGLKGNCGKVRKVFDLLSGMVSIERVGLASFAVSVDLPAKAASYFLKALEYESLSSELRAKLFAAMDSNPGELDTILNSLSFREIVELLDNMNFFGKLDATFVSSFVDLGGKDVDVIVAEYEGYFNKAVSYASKALGFLPGGETATLFDTYHGDGHFSGAATVSITPAQIEAGLSRVSTDLAVIVASFLDFTSLPITVDAQISIEDVHSVTFHYDTSTVKRGFLPVGADLMLYADETFGGQAITGWHLADNSAVVLMPDADVDVYPDFERTLTVTPDQPIDETITYDGIGYTVIAEYDDPQATEETVYTYQWYKKGKSSDTAVSGATSASFTVKTVAESGTYYCVVTATEGANSKSATTADVKITVNKAKVEVNNFTVEGLTAAYDGTVKEATVTVPTAYLNLVTVERTGDYAVTDAGTYTMSVKISAIDKGCIDFYKGGAKQQGNTVTLNKTLTVTPAVVNVEDFSWSATSFTYDKTEKTVTLNVPEAYAALFGTVEYENASKTAAGNYTADATVAFLPTASNYAFYRAGVALGDRSYTFSTDFTISPLVINVEDFVWNNVGPFTYDGTEKTVTVTAPAAIADFVSAGDIVISLSDNTATEVGSYTAKATVSFKAGESTNFSIASTVLTKTFTIGKVEVTVDAAGSWTPLTYEYSADEYTMTYTIPGLTVPFTYTGTRTASAVGTYTVTASLDTEHYVFVDADGNPLAETSFTTTWTITPVLVNGEDVFFTEDFTDPTYDGTVKSVKLHLKPEVLSLVQSGDLLVTFEGNFSAYLPGSYTAKIKLAVAEGKEDIIDLDVDTFTHNWALTKARLDLESVAWDYTDAFTYDGTAHAVAFSAVGSALAPVLSGEYTATDAGTYTASAKLTGVSDLTHDVYVGGEKTSAVFTLTWTVSPIEIDVSGITWSETDTFIYNGSAQGIRIESDPIAHTVVTLENESNVRGGTYTATATVTAENGNYVLVNGTERGESLTFTKDYTIGKATIDMSGVAMVDKTVTYNEKRQTITVTGTLPIGVTVRYEGTYTNASATPYTVTAFFTVPDEECYEAIEPMSAKLKIDPKAISIADVKFENATVDYDGNAHSLTVDAKTLPKNVNVSYSRKDIVDPGEYEITATFVLTDSTNYTLSGGKKTAKLTIVSNRYEIPSEDGEDPMIVISAEEAMALKVTADDVTEDYESLTVSPAIGKNGKVVYAADITFMNAGGNIVEIDGEDEFVVRMLIPEEYANKKIAVIHIDDEGNQEDMHATVEDGYAVFTTTHFSVYAIVTVDDSTTPAPTPMDPTMLMYIGIGAGVLLLLIIVIILIVRHNKKKKAKAEEDYVAESEPEQEPKKEKKSAKEPARYATIDDKQSKKYKKQIAKGEKSRTYTREFFYRYIR